MLTVPSGSSTSEASQPGAVRTPASTPAVTLIGPATPADTWANALLDRVLAGLRKPGQPGDGFAWWQGAEAIDLLTYTGQAVSFKGSRLSIDDQSSIVVSVVSAGDPNQLQRVASLHTAATTLVLSVSSTQPDQSDIQWMVSGSTPDIALRALVIQAAARSVLVKVAYDPGTNHDGELVLLSAQPLSGLLPTATNTKPAQTATSSPTASAPTATHAPEPDLGVLIESKLTPVFDAGLSFPSDVVTRYTAGHAWNGSLTWNEAGPRIDSRPVSVDQASTLTLQILTPNDPRGPVQPLLAAEYAGNVTRFPNEQTYFSGQRMDEILYWMVFYSARHGGLLQVSYDDFGSRQFVTLIGFVPFSQPGTQTPGP